MPPDCNTGVLLRKCSLNAQAELTRMTSSGLFFSDFRELQSSRAREDIIQLLPEAKVVICVMNELNVMCKISGVPL